MDTGAIDLSTILPYRLAILSRAVQSLLAASLDECGLTVPQWRVFLCLANRGPSTLNDVVEFTKLPQSSLSRTIARMDERGMVRSRRNPEDRRRSEIEITEGGRRQLQAAIEAVNRRCEAALALSPDERVGFQTTVEDLIQRLSPAEG
ncbi:MAG: MarR family transcriptional regulator [Phenylobacterium sp.]|uniref:MarR family winged helix-turn-helix transcriptional regulator n=1 Tax=Phenylobacterium sp. TaxID=1871053 RepID=UPI00120DC700|nr:MarR family transcriptional regulator [Phenylobacterium sp.]TAJ70298.1 MAG: MarR family transcriptional regulator [Phenylobacterium sp.]